MNFFAGTSGAMIQTCRELVKVSKIARLFYCAPSHKMDSAINGCIDIIWKDFAGNG